MSTTAARDSGAQPDEPRPPFLRQSAIDIRNKYFELQWQCRLANNSDPSRVDPNNVDKSSIGPAVGDGNIYQIMDHPDIRHLNRYLEVSPFVNQSVLLNVVGKRNNYVNASPISLSSPDSDRNWIATQGPLNSTVSDFWRMIHDATQGSKSGPIVIAMLTRIQEVDGTEKCFPYFPTDPVTDRTRDLVHLNNPYGDDWHATVTLKRQVAVTPARAVVRELELASYHLPANLRRCMATSMVSKCTKIHRVKVWHVFFSAWPDLAIPEPRHWNALIRSVGLVRHLASDQPLETFPLVNLGTTAQEAVSHTDMVSLFPPPPPANAPPVVVHCSAGVGRTGTFIALDHLIGNLLDGNLDHLVYKKAHPKAVPSTPIPLSHSKSSSVLRSAAMIQSPASVASGRTPGTPPPVPPIEYAGSGSTVEINRHMLSTNTSPPVPILSPVPRPGGAQSNSSSSSSGTNGAAKSSQPRISVKTKLPSLRLNTNAVSQQQQQQQQQRPRTAPYPQAPPKVVNLTMNPLPSLGIPSALPTSLNTGANPVASALEPETVQDNQTLVPDEDDPVFIAVATLRKQRVMMVQQALQFELLYRLLNRMWVWRAKSRPQ